MPEQGLHNGEKNNIDNIMKNTSFLTLSASTEFIIIYLAFQKGFDNVTHEDHKENTKSRLEVGILIKNKLRSQK